MEDTDRVKQKIDIVDLIAEYIPVKRAGRNFKVNCPFHSEKTPSMVISPERQIWHCFGCNKGGDIFTFVMEYEKIDFAESLKFLADRAGVKLTQSAFKSEREEKREKIYSLNHLAANYYNYLLTDHKAGKEALSYLMEKRKLPLPLIKKFGIGYAPNQTDSLSRYLKEKKKYKEEEIVDSGLATKKGFRLYDFFRNRIIFPIYDARGNIIAFSGRVLDDGFPKYINTRETLVYRKGETVFGINFAKEDIKKEGVAIVVEGEFDVISSFKEGIKNIVAVKGTALTAEQIKLLKRFAPKISFCFDSDPAGTEAQRRSIELIENEGVTASVIVPPKGKDPDELLNEDPLAFKKAVKEDINIYDFIIDSAISSFDKSSVEGKKRILEKTLPILSTIENEVVKEHYLKKLAKDLDTSIEAIGKQADKIKISKKEAPSVMAKTSATREETMEKYLLALILQSDNISQSVKKAADIIGEVPLSILAYQKLFNELKKIDEPTIDIITKTIPAELLDVFDKSYLLPITNFGEDELESEIKKAAFEVKSLAIKSVLKNLREEIREKEKTEDTKTLEELENRFSKYAKLLS